jgi:hypothetical protein
LRKLELFKNLTLKITLMKKKLKSVALKDRNGEKEKNCFYFFIISD